jgi:ectoine hydroxylase
MNLTQAQIDEYDRNGFLILPDVFTPKEIDVLITELVRVTQQDVDGINRENNGDLRSVYRVHKPASPTYSAYFEKYVTMPRVAEPAMNLLGNEDVYVFQTKCNMKQSFHGGIFQWHQDYGHWQHDGIPGPNMVTSLLMLERATELSGCLYFIPGSHRLGVVEPKLEELTSTMKMWSITASDLSAAMKKLGDPVAITGEPGTIVLFHPNMLHASGHNLSRYSRWHVYTVFNLVSNKQKPVENPRPEWAVDQEFTRIVLTDDKLEPARQLAELSA